MTEPTITKVLDPDAKNYLNRPCRIELDVKITYRDRRVICSVWVWEREAGSNSCGLTDNTNRQFVLEQMPNKRPKRIAELGATLESRKDEIWALLDDWRNEEAWPKERRNDALLQLGKLIRNELAIAA